MELKINKRHQAFFDAFVKIIKKNGYISRQEALELIMKNDLYTYEGASTIYSKLTKTGYFERFTTPESKQVFWRLKE